VEYPPLPPPVDVILEKTEFAPLVFASTPQVSPVPPAPIVRLRLVDRAHDKVDVR
jgi:hypothetical protein